MTIFRCERLLMSAAILLGACGQAASDAGDTAASRDAGVLQPTHTADIQGLIKSEDPRTIGRELPPLLEKIKASQGSIGTELVTAGFVPAPALPERYGFDRADGASVLVTIREEQVEVRVQEKSQQ